jgi:hypothetical protein
MEAYGGVDVSIPVFLTSAPVGVSGQHHASAALPQGKSPRYTLDTMLGGPLSRSGRYEVKIVDLTGIRTLTPRSSSPWPVAVPPTLPLLI